MSEEVIIERIIITYKNNRKYYKENSMTIEWAKLFNVSITLRDYALAFPKSKSTILEELEKFYNYFGNGKYIKAIPNVYQKYYLEVCKIYANLLTYLKNEIKKEKLGVERNNLNMDFNTWGIDKNDNDLSENNNKTIKSVESKYYKYYDLEPLSELETNPLLVRLSYALRPTIYKLGIGYLIYGLTGYIDSRYMDPSPFVMPIKIEEDEFYDAFRFNFFTRDSNSRLYMMGLSHENVVKEIEKLKAKYGCNSEEIVARIIFSIINSDSRLLKESLDRVSSMNYRSLGKESIIDAVTDCLKYDRRTNQFLMNYDLGNITYITFPYVPKPSEEEVDTLISEYIRINDLGKDKGLKRSLE